MELLKSIDPTTGRLVTEYPTMAAAEIEQRLNTATEQAEAQRGVSIAQRTSRFRAVAGQLRERASSLALLMATEMGKPVREGRAEIEKCAWLCDYFSDHAAGLLTDVPAPLPDERAYTHFRPLGVVLAVMPWNFPFWQVFRAAIPAIAAGNVVVFKHSSNVTGCALAIEDIVRESTLPRGTLSALIVDHDAVSRIVADDRIAAATVTGSRSAGQAVARAAGKHLKKTVLELGGSDPYLVLADADVEYAARCCVERRFSNTGQSCIAAKRWIVETAVFDRFRDAVVDCLRDYRVGDPREEETRIGPLARSDLRDKLATQVEASKAAGGRVLMGGRPLDGPGWFYAPTIMTDVPPDAPVAQEETFGPVGVVLEAADVSHAIALANETDFGLGAAVFTGDPARGEEIARLALRAGNTFVNGPVRSDPRMPFGGIGQSGYGRELGALGIREFCNAKTVCVCRP